MRVAAIDVGTNTTRLLVAEVSLPLEPSPAYRDLVRRLRFTRLGEGVDAEGRISFQAMKRTLAAIAEFLATCGELGVSEVVVGATSAVRDALNRDQFSDAVAALAGKPPQILSGAEEAKLSFMGATADLPAAVYLVCDIGGGSTELVLGTPESVDAAMGKGLQLRSVSMNLGAVRLTERYLLSDPPATEEMITLGAHIQQTLDDAASHLPGAEQAELVGLAGTVTSLAGIFLGLEEYDPELIHHSRLERDDIEPMYSQLAAMSQRERLSITSLPEGRADVIVAGAAILSAVMAKWQFNEVVVSEKDILDGQVLDLLRSQL